MQLLNQPDQPEPAGCFYQLAWSILREQWLSIQSSL